MRMSWHDWVYTSRFFDFIETSQNIRPNINNYLKEAPITLMRTISEGFLSTSLLYIGLQISRQYSTTVHNYSVFLSNTCVTLGLVCRSIKLDNMTKSSTVIPSNLDLTTRKNNFTRELVEKYVYRKKLIFTFLKIFCQHP